MIKVFFLSGLLMCSGETAFAQSLCLALEADEITLHWQRTFPPQAGVPMWKEYRVGSSDDLLQWTEQETIRVADAEGPGASMLKIPRDQINRFFRLEEKLIYGHRSSDSEQPAIYERQYQNSWEPDLALADFAARADFEGHLTGISWDPTTASFYAEFQTTPEDHNVGLGPDDLERRIYDFSLTEEELALYQKNGFVVSPRIRMNPSQIGSSLYVPPTPVDLYYAIWSDDLPVFITADSVLHAWHQTFSSILGELDEIAIFPVLKQLVKVDWDQAFHTTISAWHESEGLPEENARVRQAIGDVTLYLDLAKAFLDTTPPSDSPVALDWYDDLIEPDPNNLRKFGLYGDSDRISRPNLYKPRGRYTRSGVLAAHFRTLVWLSRAQFHIAHSSETNREQQDRELRAAVLLALTIRDGDLLEDWRRIEKTLQGIAGQSDAMTVVEMIALLESHALDSITTLASPAALSSLRAALLSSNYGVQEVNGGYYQPSSDNPNFNPCNPPAIEQPRALSLFGQRWTPDAWNFQKVVFPEVRQEGVAVPRRLPSGLDVAYAILGNDAAAPILIERMQDPAGVPFRDGHLIHQNLAAVRRTLDSQEEAFWTEHLYGRWLHGLRALSKPVRASASETFQTEAWKRRILNTQLASWTELRHDTLLYAKQSFTPPIVCEFPDGYVDPYPELWQCLSEMALAYRDFIETFDFNGSFGLESEGFDESEWLPTASFSPDRGYAPGDFPGRVIQINRGERLLLMKEHLVNFSEKCLMLQDIAEQQLAGLPHTEEMRAFIEATIEDFIFEYTGERRYNGWFPNLYFQNVRQSEDFHPSATWSPVVVDVHTNGVDDCSGDLGSILHEGTGKVQFMLTAVKHADGSICAYGGPVMSHYEFTTPLGIRLSDEEWKTKLEAGDEPAFDAWKNGYLVPSR